MDGQSPPEQDPLHRMRNTGNLKLSTPTEREIRMTRVFEAPRHLVFRAFTEPALLKRWMFGPPDWALVVCELDLRVGGTLRYEWRGPAGEQMGLSGTYREIEPPARLVHTELFDEDWTGGETLVIEEFSEREGRTTVAMTVRYATREARDGALQSGMEHGMAFSYDRLDPILAELA